MRFQPVRPYPGSALSKRAKKTLKHVRSSAGRRVPDAGRLAVAGAVPAHANLSAWARFFELGTDRQPPQQRKKQTRVTRHQAHRGMFARPAPSLCGLPNTRLAARRLPRA